MHSLATRQLAVTLLDSGLTVSEVSRLAGVSRSTVRSWRDTPTTTRQSGSCPRCTSAPLADESYAALLGFYLGDGVISRARGHYTLRISCDAGYPAIIDDVEQLISAVRPESRTLLVRAPGVVVVHANGQHWPCLFPQHGPGRKHERPIVLAPWQEEIVTRHPAHLLRGLFHSDGARVANWASRRTRGRVKRHDYSRWQFSNRSDDIHRICQAALDAVGIPWRRSSTVHTSVSTRAGVAALDDLIGLKC